MAIISKEPYITPEMIAAWNSGGGGFTKGSSASDAISNATHALYIVAKWGSGGTAAALGLFIPLAVLESNPRYFVAGDKYDNTGQLHLQSYVSTSTIGTTALYEGGSVKTGVTYEYYYS